MILTRKELMFVNNIIQNVDHSFRLLYRILIYIPFTTINYSQSTYISILPKKIFSTSNSCTSAKMGLTTVQER